MEFQEYIESRFSRQVDWYETQADTNKRLHAVIAITTIVVAMLIPALLLTLENFRVAASLLSAFLAVLVVVNHLYRFRDNWINYHITAEELKKEFFMMQAKLGDYTDTSNAFSCFVENVESIMAREKKPWLSKVSDSRQHLLVEYRKQKQQLGEYGQSALQPDRHI